MEREQKNQNIHALPVSEIFSSLQSNHDGLSLVEVEKRRVKFGANILPEREKITLFKVIVRQFLSPLIYVLIVAAAISLLLNEHADAVFIIIILFINALIGTIQEWKAESSAEALQEMISISVRVLREGVSKIVSAKELVPGDVVFLESGNKIPADLRLFESTSLLVEESILTGESVAVEKDASLILEEDIPLGDRKNMLFAGTIVTSGRAKGVVSSIGSFTEIGKIAEKIQGMKANKAPLVVRMESFSKKISIVVLIACVLLGVGGYYAGFDLQQIFFFVVAIAVSAIPEGLPIAMTVALSSGTYRMSLRNVIIRKLTAVEGLGSCTMIATDKTGTLTVDQQTVKHLILSDGEVVSTEGLGYNGDGLIKNSKGEEIKFGAEPKLDDFISAVTWCNEGSLKRKNESWDHQGDAVDVALLALSYKASSTPKKIRDTGEKVAEIPFEPENKYAAVYYKVNGRLKIAVKGAAEVILSHTSEDTSKAEKIADAYAAKGFRFIAVAHAEVDEVTDNKQLPPLKLLGFVALIDPPRKEVKEAINNCHAAGVDVSMITGDHPATALAIARDLNIAQHQSELITGTELGEYTEDQAAEFIEKVKGKRVFARVSPQQKQSIVMAMQKNKHFVAVTGDGVNDAPALKTANIGVAMGYGTDVAKEVSSIIVTDNNFASIVSGIEEGRYTYGNIRKIIYLLVSTGAAELIMIALSLIFGTPLPFLPAQILWLNLVTNGIQDKALAFEKGEKTLMEQSPRDPKEGVFNRLMISQLIVSSLTIALVSFVLWIHLLYNLHWEEVKARNTVLLLMVLLQNFHLLNCRSETRSIFKIPFGNNKWLILALILAQGVHILAMHIPFMQNLLQLQPVDWEDWLKLFTTAAIVLVVMEVFKRLVPQLNLNGKSKMI